MEYKPWKILCYSVALFPRGTLCFSWENAEVFSHSIGYTFLLFCCFCVVLPIRPNNIKKQY